MKIIGHRANSLETIKDYLSLDLDKLEVDVRVTSSSKVVLCHDKKIKKDAHLLGDALKEVNGKCPVIVEIKPGELVEPIVQVLKRHKNIEIASFDFKILLAVKKALPKVPLIVLDKWSGVRASRRARELGTSYIAMNQKWLWRGFIHNMAASGFKLSAYTLNDPVKARRWARVGLYGVVTDYPDRFM